MKIGVFLILGLLLVGSVSFIYFKLEEKKELDNELQEYLSRNISTNNYQERIPLYYNIENGKVYTRDGDLFKEVELNG